MQMNYPYNQYPFLMNLPMIYHDSYVSSANFSQQLYSFPFADYEREKTVGLKVEEKQTAIVHVKTDPQAPINVVAPKPKTRNFQSKRIQADSFTEKRNIVPNNINHILAFVQRKRKSETIVKKLIAEYQGLESYTPKRFYCYQGQLKEKLHIHVNRTTIKKLINHLDLHSQIFTVEEQLFYNRICRVLIFYYLRHIAKITILSSARVKQTSKKDHLQTQRSLLNYMLTRDYSQ